MKKETIYRKVLVSERVPSKEGRYIVSNGLGWFEVSYSKDFSFHEEFTDCSGVESWLEPVELPSDEEILQAVLVKQEKDQTKFIRGIDYILGFIDNKK